MKPKNIAAISKENGFPSDNQSWKPMCKSPTCLDDPPDNHVCLFTKRKINQIATLQMFAEEHPSWMIALWPKSKSIVLKHQVRVYPYLLVNIPMLGD